MADRRRIGLPGMPAPPASARPRCRRHVRRRDRVRHRRRHRARQGHRRASSPASAPSIVIASRKPEHLDAGHERDGRRSARRCSPSRATSASPTRSPPRSTRPSRAFGLPGVLVNNAAANFPVPAEDMSPNAWRTVVDITLNGTFFCCPRVRPPAPRGGHARRRSSTSARRTRGPAGPGFAHSAAAKAGVKNLTETLAVEWGPYGIQVNGLVPGLIPARGHDRRHPGQPRPAPTTRTSASPRCASASARSSAGRPRSWPRPTPASSPATRSWSTAPTGSAAALTNPPVVTVRDQMGRGDFTLDARR